MGWPWPLNGSDAGNDREPPPKLMARPRQWIGRLMAGSDGGEAGSLELARQWAPGAAITLGVVGVWRLYALFLRRIPGVPHIRPSFFRSRTLYGRVTSVGDGDNFHMYHTPGGMLAGWGWLRTVPRSRAALKQKTIPIRIAGVDAPEGAHFGRPAQPHAAEALQWLSSYLLNRPVWARIYKRDQYERVVATVHVSRWCGLLRRDVGLQMLRRGLATTYEAKTGAEFGGLEEKYRREEERARQKGFGLWAGWKKAGKNGGDWESPRQYKARYAIADAGDTTGRFGTVDEVVERKAKPNGRKAKAEDKRKGEAEKATEAKTRRR